MKKILGFTITLLMCLSMAACSIAGMGTDTAQQDRKINTDFSIISGEENLYYCNDTKIVYWIGGSYTVNAVGSDYTTSYMVAYFAPNGKPYIYNTATNNIEEIN